MTVLPDGDIISSSHDAAGSSEGESAADNYGDFDAESYTHNRSSTRIKSRSYGHSKSHSHAHTKNQARTKGNSSNVALNYSKNRSATKGRTAGESLGYDESESESEARGRNKTWTTTKSITIQPWYAYKKRRVVSSRTFLSKEEQLTLALQKIKAQGTGHFVLKTPNHPAVFMRAPYVPEPRISTRALEAARQRIFSQPCYVKREEVEVQEQKLLEAPSTTAIEPFRMRGNHGYPITDDQPPKSPFHKKPKAQVPKKAKGKNKKPD